MALPPPVTRRPLLAIVAIATGVLIASSLAVAAAQQVPQSPAESDNAAGPPAQPSEPNPSATPSTPATEFPAEAGTSTPTQSALPSPQRAAVGKAVSPTSSRPASTPRASARTTPQATPAPPKPAPASGPRIVVSRSSGLDPDGTKVTVTGSGFDTSKGIYVALCVKPARGQAPTPCGGGADTSGSSQASAWVSSNPPPYGANLAVPYGSGRAFRVTLDVGALIGSLDCRTTSCVIATRNDHTRTGDRSHDVLVPVTFART